MTYSDQLLAEKESIPLDSISEILLGYSEKELSQFETVFNHFLNQFSDSEKEERTLWKVDKKQMAREIANHVQTQVQAQIHNQQIIYSFHLIKDFYPKEVMRNQDIKKTQNIFNKLLIALQASSVLKGWLEIKYPSYPLIPVLELSIWINNDGVMGKLKSQVKDFKVSKRAKEFFNHMQAVGEKQNKEQRLNNDAIKKDAADRGRKGGLKSSGLEGVLSAIKGILMGNKSLSAEQVWLNLAQYKSLDEAMQVGNKYELYIEGNTLYQNDQKTAEELSIKRSSFDRYVSKVKKPI